LSMRSFIVEFPAFGAWRSMKIRISAMIESPKAGSEMLQSPEAAIKAVDWIRDRGDAAL